MEKENIQEIQDNHSDNRQDDITDSKPADVKDSNVEQEQDNEKKQEEKPKRIINVEEEMKVLKREKEEGDKQMQIDLKKAITIYSKSLETINEIKETGPEQSVLSQIIDYEKRIVSNLALANFKFKNYEKAIDYDLMIINDLDKNFDKSYARLIKSNILNNDLEEAIYFYSKMFQFFNKITLEKYSDVFKLLEEKCKDNPKFIKEINKIKKSSKKWSKLTWIMIVGILLLLGLIFYGYFTNKIFPDKISEKVLENVESNDILSN